MEKIMPLVLDAAVIVMVFWTVYTSASKGFVASVIDLIGYVAALVGSRIISKFVSQMLYDSVLRPLLIDRVSDVLNEYFTVDQLIGELDKIFDELPAVLTNAINLDSRNLIAGLQQNSGMGTNLAAGFTDAIVGPAVIGILQIVLFLVLFSVTLYAVHMLSSLFQEMYRLPVVGAANSILGGAVGMLESILLIFAFTTLLKLIFVLSGNAISWLNTDTVRASNILSKLYEYNPLLK